MSDERHRELPVEYEPRLVEEAVLAAIDGRPAAAEFRAGRDALYAIADPDAREARFQTFHAVWFERLGLGEAVTRAIREQPALEMAVARCLVALARARREEGAELFVSAPTAVGAAGRRTLVIQLHPETLRRPDCLRALLRRELLHVADMLDPDFGYTPIGLEDTDLPLPERLFRERYRVLWDAFVDGRLERRGWAPLRTRTERLGEFAATFPMLGVRVEEAFERFFGGAACTHAHLVAFATAPEQALGRERRGPHPGERCAACGSPTHAFEPHPERLPPEVRERVRRSVPGWEAADGLCRQCTDLYRARSAHASRSVSQ